MIFFALHTLSVRRTSRGVCGSFVRRTDCTFYDHGPLTVGICACVCLYLCVCVVVLFSFFYPSKSALRLSPTLYFAAFSPKWLRKRSESNDRMPRSIDQMHPLHHYFEESLLETCHDLEHSLSAVKT